MSLLGFELEIGGRAWSVVSNVREGPEWRIILRGVDDPRCTITARFEGASPPTSIGDLRGTLANPESRTFRDEQGDRWRVEVIPRMEKGRKIGDYLSFSAEMKSQRLRIPHDSITSIATVSDAELRKGLRWAMSSQTTA